MTVRKIAVFVEGLTEITFFRRLLTEIAGQHRVVFEEQTLIGQSYLLISGPSSVNPETKFHFLLVNCNNDERVKSAMRDQAASLSKAGYEAILGVRDLYPIALAELHKVEQGLPYGLEGLGISTELFLSVAEIEAWFIQEHSHFQKIHNTFDLKFIQHITGVDLANTTADKIERPAQFLDQVYSTQGLRYRKKKSQITRTVEAIDYCNLYVSCTKTLPHLNQLAQRLNQILA